jgi:hypothetical protein
MQYVEEVRHTGECTGWADNNCLWTVIHTKYSTTNKG